MKSFRKPSALFILLLFLFSSAPKELIHFVFHEHESVDIICHDTCADHLSIEHKHCELLQLSQPPFCTACNCFSLVANQLLFEQQIFLTTPYQFHSAPFLFFRGPPQLG